MHPTIYSEFESILEEHKIEGKVLEVGAKPDETALLNSSVFEGVEKKVGVNLERGNYKDFKVKENNANNLEFDDNTFDVIVCNATLEHDKYFWKTISEIKRVAKDGCLIVIGIPGFTENQEVKKGIHRITGLFDGIIDSLQFTEEERSRNLHQKTDLKSLSRRAILKINRELKKSSLGHSGALTFVVHNAPADYYRFSTQAVEEVFLEGCKEIEVREVMSPPRLIGKGVYRNQ